MEPNLTVTRTTTSAIPATTGMPVNNVSNNPSDYGLAKFNQIIWFIIGIINILILIRFILLLLGANPVSIVGLIYNLSIPFVWPFYGIFGQPTFGESYFETASIVAIVIYSLIGFLITNLLRVLSSDTK